MAVVDEEHDHGPFVTEQSADAIGRETAPKQRLRLGDDHRVASVEEDAQPLGPRELGDVAVPEVEPEELGIVARARRPPASSASSTVDRLRAATGARTAAGASREPLYAGCRGGGRSRSR